MTDSGQQWPQFPAQSGPPPTPPPRKSPYRWWWRAGVPVLLILICAGLGLKFGPGPSKDDPPAGSSSKLSPSSTAPAPRRDGADKVKGTVPKGSRASSYGVRKVEDLNRVCDGRFYPKAPRYRGLAPHSIVLGVKDQKDSDSRVARSRITLPYESAPGVETAWNPEDPKKVQLMACADQISVGAKVKTCQVDKPKPEKIPMKVSTYRVTLYEVATRRRLAQLKMTGEDETCGPFLIIVGADGATYSGLDDRQLIEGLRRYVEE
jgi:hypothetical protein